MPDLQTPQIEHQLDKPTLFSGNQGLGPRDWSQLDSSLNSLLFRGVYGSRTPIWTRIGQKSIWGHPFENKLENMIRFCWEATNA